MARLIECNCLAISQCFLRQFRSVEMVFDFLRRQSFYWHTLLIETFLGPYYGFSAMQAKECWGMLGFLFLQPLKAQHLALAESSLFRTNQTLGPLFLWGATATALKERGWAAEPPREMSDANSNTDVTSVSTDDPRGPFDVEMEVPWSANETGWNAVFAARDGQILRFDLGRTAVSRWGMCWKMRESTGHSLHRLQALQGTNMSDLYLDATNALFTEPRMKRFRFCLCFSDWIQWPTYLGGRGATSKFLARAEWQQRTEGLPEKKSPCALHRLVLLKYLCHLLAGGPLFRRCCRCQRPVQWWTLVALDRLGYLGYLGVGLALQ